MIKISINRQDGHISSFEISGHANSGPYGYDLVCAAVSAISFGSVNAVLKLSKLELQIEQAENGYLHVDIPHEQINIENFSKAQLIFEAMIISLQTIEREYEQFIRISDN